MLRNRFLPVLALEYQKYQSLFYTYIKLQKQHMQIIRTTQRDNIMWY